jgi:hypothetical protein
MRLAQRLGGDFAQAQRAQLAGANQVAHGPDAVLDGHRPRARLVPAVQVVQVDDVRLQALQAVFAVAPDGLGAAVDHPLQRPARPDRLAAQAALGAQHITLAVPLHRTAEQRLVGAKAIERCGVEQRHAGVQRVQQQALGIGLLWRQAIGVAEAHAAQADGRDGEGTHAAHAHLAGFSRLRH